jgi:hypothetical protein
MKSTGGDALTLLNINLQKLEFLIPCDLGDYNIQTSKFFFLGCFLVCSELELFLLMGVLTPNFNTMDLIKILEKNQKLHIQIVSVTLKVTSCRTMSKKKK